jgi:NAD(P)-dependent dehydrogenase (short-subunit alcohol dehydrogenase family)
MEKVAVVTGASKGLGKAVALSLANEGYKVVVHFKDSVRDAELVVSEINKVSEGFAASADLTSEKEVEEMFDKILGKFRRVDILVNNVGNFLYKKFGDTTNGEFRDVMESNIYSTLFCSRFALKLMRKQKSGHIVNIGAVGAERFTFRENSVPYFLAKNGVYILTKTMAWEEARNGIHVNMVSPASMKTDIFKKNDFPMGRETQYQDVVKAVLFLISEKAYYINGANIEVSGAFIPGMI